MLMNKIIAAFQFLTILPFKTKDFREELLAESTAFFPLVGLTLGVGLSGLEYSLSLFLPISIVRFQANDKPKTKALSLFVADIY